MASSRSTASPRVAADASCTAATSSARPTATCASRDVTPVQLPAQATDDKGVDGPRAHAPPVPVPGSSVQLRRTAAACLAATVLFYVVATLLGSGTHSL